MTLQNTSSKTPIIAIASGKGGVGKTSFTVNLATAMAKSGKNILVFDADIGLANVDVQLGMSTTKDISHVLAGQCTLTDIIAKTPQGFSIIPGRSGFDRTPFMSPIERKELFNKLRDVAQHYDLLLLDVAAGLDAEVLGFTTFADRTILVTTPDPSSITDAYAVIKLLKQKYDKQNCMAMINQAGSVAEGKATYKKLATAADRFLGVQLPILGIIPHDRQYSAAVKMQQLSIIAFPNCDASVAIRKVAVDLLAIA
jgi:flagellar biosynthesis protein FlhG